MRQWFPINQSMFVSRFLQEEIVGVWKLELTDRNFETMISQLEVSPSLLVIRGFFIRFITKKSKLLQI